MSSNAAVMNGDVRVVPLWTLCLQMVSLTALAGGLTYWALVFATESYEPGFTFWTNPLQAEAPTAPKLEPAGKLQHRILPDGISANGRIVHPKLFLKGAVPAAFGG